LATLIEIVQLGVLSELELAGSLTAALPADKPTSTSALPMLPPPSPPAFFVPRALASAGADRLGSPPAGLIAAAAAEATLARDVERVRAAVAAVLDTSDACGESALHVAAQHPRVGAMALLLRAGASVERPRDWKVASACACAHAPTGVAGYSPRDDPQLHAYGAQYTFYVSTFLPCTGHDCVAPMCTPPE